MSYKFLTTPDDLVVDLELVKSDMRLDGDDFDDDLEALVLAATEELESDCRRQLLEREWTLYLDRFPSPCAGNHGRDILIEKCPVSSVDAVRYINAAGVLTTLAADQYRADIVGEPCRVSPAYGLAWPVTRVVSNAVEVDFTAGYGVVADVPDIAKQAIRARVRELFEGCAGNGGVDSLKLRLKWGDAWRK